MSARMTAKRKERHMPEPKPKPPFRVRCNPRRLSRARYERGATDRELAILMIREIDRMLREGEVPLNVAVFALECSLDELRDRQAEESVSWADDPARARCFGLARDTDLD